MSAPAAAISPQLDPMLPRAYRIARVRRELADTFTAELVPEDGGDIPPFRPGQFNMVYVFGVGEIPISISGDPARRLPLVHTTRAVGTVSKAMCGLRRDDVVGVRGPYGKGWPLELAVGRDVVLVAGGIGLAPLRPVVRSIMSDRDRYGRVALLYGARTPADLIYRREVASWSSRRDLDVYVTVDYATSAWHGSVGVVTRIIPRAPFDPQTAIAMACGPEIMMRFTALELEKRGIAADRIYVSLERNMKCAVGHCGHCQYSTAFVCKDGPVFPYGRIKARLAQSEI